MESLEPFRLRFEAGLRLRGVPVCSAFLGDAQALHQEEPLLFCVDRRDGISPVLLEQFGLCLSESERQRHDAYRLKDDRERFLIARASLKLLLGDLLKAEPGSVSLEVAAYGKPFCPGGPQFNVSHSGDLILLGFHAARAVGVDVEQRRPVPEWLRIARRMLADDEIAVIQRTPEPLQTRVFLETWCGLEARLKAAGGGLGVAAFPHAQAQQHRQWSLILPSGYVGVAVLL